MATFLWTGLLLHTKDEFIKEVKLACNNYYTSVYVMSALQIDIDSENVLANYNKK